jgi:nucleotide-binding universal stress UspA family protein
MYPMKLLIPFDGSAAAAHALAHALHLAEQGADSLLILLNVQNVQTLGLSDILPREETAALGAEASEELLAKPAYQCGIAGVRCVARAEYGPVAETIVQVARETKTDQIVMGTRGLGRLQGLVLGSVATQVVHLADVPVTLVKETKAKAARHPTPAREEQLAMA